MSETPPYTTPALSNYFISSLAQTLNAGSSDTSIQLGTIYTLDGQVVQTADFAAFGRGIVTIDPLNLNSVEFISFTGVTATTPPTGTLTGTLRGLSFKGNNQISANQKFHVVGTPVLIAFGTHNIIDLVSMINTTYSTLLALIETIVIEGGVPASTTQVGFVRITQNPTVELGTCTISEANPAVITVTNTLTVNDTVVFSTSGVLPSPIIAGTTYYVLSAGLSTASFEISLTPGGTPINTTGSSQSGTQTVSKTTPIAVTAQDPNLPYQYQDISVIGNEYQIQTNTIIPALVKGMQFEFIADSTNGGPPVLQVNSNSSIAIVKNGSQPLQAGDIVAGQIYLVSFDGTYFQLLGQQGQPTAYANGVAAYAGTTLTITHGLSSPPKKIFLNVMGGLNPSLTTGGISYSQGSWDASGQSSIHNVYNASAPALPASDASHALSVVGYSNGGATGAQAVTGTINSVGSTTFTITFSTNTLGLPIIISWSAQI